MQHLIRPAPPPPAVKSDDDDVKSTSSEDTKSQISLNPKSPDEPKTNETCNNGFSGIFNAGPMSNNSSPHETPLMSPEPTCLSPTEISSLSLTDQKLNEDAESSQNAEVTNEERQKTENGESKDSSLEPSTRESSLEPEPPGLPPPPPPPCSDEPPSFTPPKLGAPPPAPSRPRVPARPGRGAPPPVPKR